MDSGSEFFIFIALRAHLHLRRLSSPTCSLLAPSRVCSECVCVRARACA